MYPQFQNAVGTLLGLFGYHDTITSIRGTFVMIPLLSRVLHHDTKRLRILHISKDDLS